MFAIFKNKEFFECIWNKIASDELLNPQEFTFENIETFNHKLVLTEDVHLFFLHDKEGIIGKVTLSHISRVSDLSLDWPLADSVLIIKNVDYHINSESHIHEEVDTFEKITHNFYQTVLNTALWICQNLSLESIITISDHSDDHEDLTYWGDFDFSTFLETSNNVIGILSIQNKDNGGLNSNIKYISNVVLH